MFKIGDKVQFQWVYLHTGVVTGVIDDKYPIEVTLDHESDYFPEGVEYFAEDGAFIGDGERILEHRPLLGGSYPDCTVAELDGTRMVMLGGTWTLSNGEVLYLGVYEALKDKPVDVLFSPEKGEKS